MLLGTKFAAVTYLAEGKFLRNNDGGDHDDDDDDDDNNNNNNNTQNFGFYLT